MAQGQNMPGGLAIDGANVYWTTADGKVMKAPIAGGGPTVLATGQRSPRGIAIDATSAYWVNEGSPGQVVSVPLAGGAPTVLADQQRGPVHVAVADSVLYWVNAASGGTVMSMPVSGGTPRQLADAQGTPVAVAVDGGRLYWSSAGQDVIRSLPVAGGVIATVVDDQDAEALFFREGTLYWANTEVVNDVASVYKLPPGGDPVALASGPGPYAAVADSQYVYWTDETAGTVSKVPVGGGDAVVIAKDQFGASDLAIDGANLYWLDDITDGAIMKLVK
jgi:hypothetical protein